MEERIGKDELIELLETLRLDKEEYSILSTSALVLRGIYKDSGDLDIAVTEKGLNELKENYDLISKGDGWYIVEENVECVLDDSLVYKREKYGDYYLEDLEIYYDFLRQRNSDNDEEKIKLIEKYLN